MTYQTSDFFFKSLATQGQAALNNLGNRFKPKSVPMMQPPSPVQPLPTMSNVWGNTKLSNSRESLTRNQRSANIKDNNPIYGMAEQNSAQSVGRGLNKQQAPRQNNLPLKPNQFLDAGGVVRTKMSVGDWKNQQKSQTGMYGGFSSPNFQHFANF